MVAGCEPGHSLSHLLHHPGPLVTQHDGQGDRPVQIESVQVAPADGCGGKLDQHLARLGRLQLDLLHHQGRLALVHHRRFGFHRLPARFRVQEEGFAEATPKLLTFYLYAKESANRERKSASEPAPCPPDRECRRQTPRMNRQPFGRCAPEAIIPPQILDGAAP